LHGLHTNCLPAARHKPDARFYLPRIYILLLSIAACPKRTRSLTTSTMSMNHRQGIAPTTY